MDASVNGKRQILANAIAAAAAAKRELLSANEACERIRSRVRAAAEEHLVAEANYRASGEVVAAEALRGETLTMTGARRLARDRVADAADELEALRDAPKRIEASLPKLENSELYARMKVRDCVAEVVAAEALDELLVNYTNLRNRAEAAHAALRAISHAVQPGEITRRIDHCLVAPGPSLTLDVPPAAMAWKAAIAALAKDASAELPKGTE